MLNIRVQGYTPEFAHDMASLLLEAGENHMNEMGHRLADEQVHFLERQMVRLEERFEETRAQLLEFQNEYGLVSPTATVESINQVVATLEGDLARLQAQRNALASFQSSQSAELRQVERSIAALRDQITEQRDRLAQATGNSLNRVSAEYETLELQAQFAQETYSSALAALEKHPLRGCPPAQTGQRATKPADAGIPHRAQPPLQQQRLRHHHHLPSVHPQHAHHDRQRPPRLGWWVSGEGSRHPVARRNERARTTSERGTRGGRRQPPR